MYFFYCLFDYVTFFPDVMDRKAGSIGLSASSESIYQTKYSRSRGNSIRHRPHRTSSRRNKENGSSGFRRKNSFKKPNVLIINENVKKLNCTVNNNISESNSNLNVDKVLKVNFQNCSPESSQNKSHLVSFGEMPALLKVTSASKGHHTILLEQDRLQNQSYFRKYIKILLK